jgi:uncharacterized protein (TIGR02246 family)
MQCRIPLVAIAIMLCPAMSVRLAAQSIQSAAPSRDEQAIRDAASKYVEALQRGDAKAMLSLWVPEGDIVDEFGRARPAREVIEGDAKSRTAQPAKEEASPRVNLTQSSIRFLTPHVAIEDGTVEVTSAGNQLSASRGRFLAMWVKGDDGWKLASLREGRAQPTIVDDLVGLDAMVGDWTGQNGKTRFDVSAHWNDKHTFLLRDLTVMHDGKVVTKATQRIGVDPLDGKIKSWMHDADGGHGEGLWSRHGNTWVVQASGVTPDGRQTSGTNVYAYDGKNQLSWKSTAGMVGSQKMPDFEIALERVGAIDK